MKSLLLTILAAVTAAGIFMASLCGTSVAHAADQSRGKVVTLPVARTSPANGKQMYGSYCASCHGVNGRGDGPVGATLKTKPADLTVLSKNNGGKYPSSHVATVLQDGSTIPTHGPTDMPVWGPLLGKMDKANPEERALRISNLSSYLESIQAK